MFRFILKSITSFAELTVNCLLYCEDASESLTAKVKNRKLKYVLVTVFDLTAAIAIIFTYPIFSIGWHADNVLYELYHQYEIDDSSSISVTLYRSVDCEIDWDWKKEGF